jgi:hypothetical protein
VLAGTDAPIEWPALEGTLRFDAAPTPAVRARYHEAVGHHLDRPA